MNVVIQSSGAAIASITAVPPARATTGRRITALAQRSQSASLPSSVVRQGRRSRKRSMPGPAAASSAGRSVTEARTEIVTTTIAPTAIERSPLTSIANSAASDTATVAPLKTTAVPELASARASAPSRSAPSRSSRRKRLTTNNE